MSRRTAVLVDQQRAGRAPTETFGAVPIRPELLLKSSPTQALDEDERREIAYRLLCDDHLDTRDRAVGLLNYLYAQPSSLIIRLTADHVVVREKSQHFIRC
ncbi:hypothetical protein JHN63_39075 [Streptomyces sp. MBT65]|uniref:hypothetical protein n=1 Tax=Streptomyces sp. MBT65 TaxID=1488395 RepID=UPI00190A1CA2|nr:hypothetical protein [Streptomyces sp. MBT65]MBK3579697.1 hypothetical protein [Streptomyces sp. MBT65]